MNIGVSEVSKREKPQNYTPTNSFDDMMFKLKEYWEELSEEQKKKTDLSRVWSQLLLEELNNAN